jgi:hypothetical protein
VCDYFSADVRAAGCILSRFVDFRVKWLSFAFHFRVFCGVFESSAGFVHGCSINCKRFGHDSAMGVVGLASTGSDFCDECNLAVERV